VRGIGILGSSLSAYRASTGPGYPSGCCGLYNACIVGRVVTHFSTHTTRPSLYAPATLRGTSGGATILSPVGWAQLYTESTVTSSVLGRTGFYHRVGACCPTWLRLFALPRSYAAGCFLCTGWRGVHKKPNTRRMITPSPASLAYRGGAGCFC
jgi:hypothetical protein